jgi:hypothetical protein
VNIANIYYKRKRKMQSICAVIRPKINACIFSKRDTLTVDSTHKEKAKRYITILMTKLNGKFVCNNEMKGLRITRIEKACIKLNGWKRKIWKWQIRQKNSSPSP